MLKERVSAEQLADMIAQAWRLQFVRTMPLAGRRPFCRPPPTQSAFKGGRRKLLNV